MKLKFFKLAKKVSRLSTHPKFKLGAVIVKKNDIISLAANKLKTHPKSNNIFNQLHAEIAALLNVDKVNLKGCQIYMYREHADGTLAMSKPCKYCMSALAFAGIEQVCFTSDLGFKEENLNE